MWRGLSGGLEELNTCAPNPGRTEGKYGNPARTPPAPAAPTPQGEEVRGPGPHRRGLAIQGSLGEARGASALGTHALGAGQGLLGLGGGSALRSGFLLSATVLTRFLEPPSDIYLTSQFSLPGASREGWRQGGKGQRRWGARGKHFLPSAQAPAASLPRGVPPRTSRLSGINQPLGFQEKSGITLAHLGGFKN